MLHPLRRLAAYFRRTRLEDDLAEEIHLHLELRTQALIDRGMAPADAAREARRQFGNPTLVRERTREIWGGSWLDHRLQDVRFGLRGIRKAPVFSVVAIASLAAGIGASTVIFSVANSFLLRPVQAADPEDLVQVFTSGFSGSRHGGSSYADYEVFRTVPVFDGLMASMRTKATLSGNERPEVIEGLLVSGNYFEVLGLRPSLGRFFSPEEYRTPGTHPVVVLSHDGWRRRLAEDPAVIGRIVELSGHTFTVIGVGPPRFAGTSIEDMADFFVPATMSQAFLPGADLLHDRRYRAFRLLGRLRDGTAVTAADAALRVVAADLARHDPVAWLDQSGNARVVTVMPEIASRFVGAPDGAVAFIFSSVTAGVVALLTIACVNVATVLLARASTRRREIAVRLALGASRRRVIGQLLTEASLLAAAGGTLGLLLAQGVAALFIRFRPDGVPAFDLTLDSRILVFSMAASVLTVVLFGLAPALQTTRPDVNAELKNAVRTIRVRGWRFNLRSALVVVQVAVSLAMMVGAALMLRSAHAGRTEDPGFRRDDVLSVGIDLETMPTARGAHARYYDEAVRAIAALPGVERAALARLVPMDGSNSQRTIRISNGGASFTTSPDINIVGAGYFALLDIPVLQGREFTEADRAGSMPVAVVNDSMSQRAWQGQSLGRTFAHEQTGEVFQIVGVVRDLRHRSFGEEPIPMVYFSAAQTTLPRMTLHIRTAVSAGVLGPAVHRVLHDINRSAGLTRVETMHEYFARITLPQQASAAAAMAAAGLELVLVVMALYGVIAFAAAQRRHEIGLRMALGASRSSVLRLVMREGLVLTAIGAVIGTAIALAGASVAGSVLIGVGPADPVSFVGGALVLLAVGAAASYVPARAALEVDPSVALRSE